MRNCKGFTLIELLVVIAIVALLSAIAVPAYQNYAVRAKLSAANTFASDIMLRAKTYYAEKGVFPNLAQVGGVTTQVGDDIQTPSPPTEPGSVAPNVDYASLDGGNGLHSCPSVMLTVIAGQFKSDEVGVLAGGTGLDSAYIFKHIVDVDGVLMEKCYYYVTIDGGATFPSGDYIDNCVNAIDNPDITTEIESLSNSCA